MPYWLSSGAIRIRLFVVRALAAALLIPLTNLELHSADPSLVAAYHCNEATGTTLTDVSGNGNNGIVPAATWNAGGKFGAALDLNGTSQFVTVPDSASLDLTSGMTLEAWVYPTATTNWQTVLLKESGGGLAYALYARSNANRPAAYVNIAGVDRAASSGSGLPRNAWSHVAATYSGVTVTLYVNGVLRSSSSVTGTLPATSSPLRIGGNTVWGEYFKGRIDEIRIYNRALNAAEIQSDMTLPISSAPSVTITSPMNNASVNGAILVSATASAGAGVAGVQFKLDGQNLGAEDVSSPYQITWNTTSASNGLHGLTAVVRDTTGVLVPSATTTVNVANGVAPPTVSVTFPTNGSTVTGSITVSASANGDGGIAGVQFLLDGASLGTELTSPPFQVTWNTTAGSDGAHTLSARARDNFGVSTTSTPVAVTVANYSNPGVTGEWSSLRNWPLVALNAILLRTGKVLVYDRYSSGASVRVWDPQSESFISIPNNTTDLFCSGHVALADGRILVVGGHGGDFTNNTGVSDVNIFDPVSLTWTLGPPMAYKRWYPTATLLQDGRALVHTGAARTLLDYVAIPEIYNPSTNSWTQLSGAPLATPTYAQMYLLPNGKVANPGNYEAAVETRILDVATQSWTMVDPVARDGGSVMYDLGKVLKCGASADSGFTGPSSRACLLMDFNVPTPVWQTGPSMAYPRAFHNMTILPDGSVLATGGGTQRDGYYVENAVYHAELWSPVTNTWSTMAPAAKPRLYHSSAVLLPDGRVLSAGGGRDGPGVDQLNAEIYSPPYLFKGARPVITSAPETLQYSASFAVETPNAAEITAVTLMRPGAATHAFDQEQRFQRLNFQQSPGGLLIEAPANANLAPPGYYMLFLINSNGVPSVAKFVRLPLATTTDPPGAPTNLTAAGGVGRISLSWTAANGTNGVALYNVHRSSSSGFVPSLGNRIGQVVTTAYVDSNLPSGRYYYTVSAQDTNEAVGPQSNEAFADSLADNVPPQVSLTEPMTAAVTGTVTVSATASDDNNIAGVQFLLNGSNLGNEVMSPPYSIQWNTASVTNGTHEISARARDDSGNTTISSPFVVTVANNAPSGQVLAMAFNEGAGTTTEDRSGYSQSGLLSNTTWSATGKFGGALSFNGSSSSVIVTDSNALDLTNGMTLMAWVRPAAGGSWRTVLLKEGSGDLAYALYSSTDSNRPGGYFVTSGGVTRGLQAGTALPLNAWTHVALNYNGTTMTLFVNGAQVGSAGAAGGIGPTSGPLRIGGNSIWAEWFNGLIDEVRVFNRALSLAEIQSVINTPIAP